MPEKSKKPRRPVVNIDDFEDLAMAWGRLMSDMAQFERMTSQLERVASACVDKARERSRLMREAGEALLAVMVKAQAATKPAKRSAYSKQERATLKATSRKRGGWKEKRPTSARAQKSTVTHT